MGTETESVKIPVNTMIRLRKYISKTAEGRVYGKISDTINTAIIDYLDKHEKIERQKVTA
jgi:hypothetical protein